MSFRRGIVMMSLFRWCEIPLPIKPEEIFQVAKYLSLSAVRDELPDSFKEALRRSAVSRFYYAAYIKAEEFASEGGYQFHQCPRNLSFGTHEALWKWWFKSRHGTLSTMGDSLHQTRILADYRTQRDFSYSVEKAQNLSQRIIGYIDKNNSNWPTTQYPGTPLVAPLLPSSCRRQHFQAAF